ncbi:uncharacterized protein LOC129245901 [Anastrepha obliqua]|uniref:uncharacterized protein LOC129245901 n=1 Tax=Anastrepha obliqua TaxID=95512 RepID=UPI002409EA9F|nr:uncharacterized protein LOC129245901 [Anastrepha obliqua]XP_054740314.1 uncharacterized protein LOC129245901 [Anastrepha obliqua]
MSHPAACYKGIILLATFTVLAHYAFEPVFAGSGGRDEPKQSEYNVLDENNYEHLTPHKRPSFFVGSRYGRSGGGIGLSSSKIRRLSVVPRNDRFFLGSRYGKRAEGNSAAELFSPYEKQTADDNVDGFALQHMGDNKLAYSEHENFSEKQQQQQPQLQSSSMISCVYTGFRNYYRCRNIDEINNIINQLTVAHSIEEGK